MIPTTWYTGEGKNVEIVKSSVVARDQGDGWIRLQGSENTPCHTLTLSTCWSTESILRAKCNIKLWTFGDNDVSEQAQKLKQMPHSGGMLMMGESMNV